MKITKYPQSAILMEYKGKRILIDPGSYCYNDSFTPDSWGKVDVLLITHEHSDHFVPAAIKVVKQNNPNLVIFTNSNVQKLMKNEEIDSEVIKPGEKKEVGGVFITGVAQVHGPLPSGKPRPEVIGFLVDDKLYHPGDTEYIKEKPYAEVVCAPICGTVVMNPGEAARFCKEISPKISIPVHYDNPKYPVDANDFVKEMGGYPVKVLANGESLEI